MVTKGSNVTGGNSAIVLYPQTPDEIVLDGLTTITLPVGYEISTVESEAIGTLIAATLPTGAKFQPISFDYEYIARSEAQRDLRLAGLASKSYNEIRFMVNHNMSCGDFSSLDLISQPEGHFKVGTFGNPTAGRNDIIKGSGEFLQNGLCTLFEYHASGINLKFSSAATTGANAQVESLDTNVIDFVDRGFVAGMVMYLDNVNSLHPLCVLVESVTADKITFTLDQGDDSKIPDFTGIDITAIHGGYRVDVASMGITC